MEKKTVATSVNLPVETIMTVINMDDPNVEVKVSDMASAFKSNAFDSFHTMNTQITVNNASEMQGQRNLNLKNIEFLHDSVIVNKIERKKIEKTNELKFYKVVVNFSNGNEREFIVPSFVKFYSSRRASFVPVEFIRNRDILLDYAGNIVKICDAVLVEDFKMTDFYNIGVIYEVMDSNIEEDMNNNVRHLNETCNFYLNGILANVPYNNFQKKEVKE